MVNFNIKENSFEWVSLDFTKFQIKPKSASDSRYPVLSDVDFLDHQLDTKLKFKDKIKNCLIWRDRQMIKDICLKSQNTLILGHGVLEHLIRLPENPDETKFILLKIGSNKALIHISNTCMDDIIQYTCISSLLSDNFHMFPNTVISIISIDGLIISSFSDVLAIKKKGKVLPYNRVALWVNNNENPSDIYIHARANLCEWVTNVQVDNKKIIKIETNNVLKLDKIETYKKRYHKGLAFAKLFLERCLAINIANDEDCVTVDALKDTNCHLSNVYERIRMSETPQNINTVLPCVNITTTTNTNSESSCGYRSNIYRVEMVYNGEVSLVLQGSKIGSRGGRKLKTDRLNLPLQLAKKDIVEIIQNDVTRQQVTLLACENMNSQRILETLSYMNSSDDDDDDIDFDTQRLELKCSVIRCLCPYIFSDIIYWLEGGCCEDDHNNYSFSSEMDIIMDRLTKLLWELCEKCVSARLGGLMIAPSKPLPKKNRSSANISQYGHLNPCVFAIENFITINFINILLPIWVYKNTRERLQYSCDLLTKIVDLLPLYTPFLRSFINKISEYAPTTASPFLLKLLYRLMDCVSSMKGMDEELISWRNLPSMPIMDCDEESLSNLPSMKKIFNHPSDYQETIYRLLRAHCFYKMRKSIYSLKIDHKTWDPREMNCYKITVKKVLLKKNISGPIVEILVNPYTIKYIDGKMHHYRRPTKPKDLMINNLVCINLRGLDFKSENLIIAVVNEQPEFKKKTSELLAKLLILDDPSLPNKSRTAIMQIEELIMRRGVWLWMFESNVLYPAYRAPLEVLRTREVGQLSLINEIMGCAPPKVLSVPNCPILSPELDESQIAAVLNALTTPFSIIQGPPGTGKSHVGLELLRLLFTDKGAKDIQNNFLKNDSNNRADDVSTQTSSESSTELSDDETAERNKDIKVLWVSYKNHITDEMLKKTLNKDILSREEVCRLGGRADESVQELSLRYKTRNLTRRHEESRNYGLYKGLQESIISELTKLSNEMEQNLFDAQLITNIATPAQLDDIIKCCKTCSRNDHSQMINFILSNTTPIKLEDIPQIEPCIRSWLKIGFSELERFKENDPQVDPSALEDEESDEEEAKAEIRNRFAFVGEQSGDAAWSFDLAQMIGKDRFFRLKTDDFSLQNTSNLSFFDMKPINRIVLLKNLEKEYIEKKMKPIKHNISVFDGLSSSLKQIDNVKNARVVKACKLLVCTVTGASINSEVLHAFEPTHVIIEEAAQILEPLIIAAIPTSVKVIIQIGDHKQLRPTMEHYDLRKTGLDTSLMERLINAKNVTPMSLKYQNRAIPELVELIEHIYPGLDTNDEAVKYHKPLCFCSKVCYFFDHQYDESSDGDKGTKSNQGEANMIFQFIDYMRHERIPLRRISIITGYLGQKRILRAMTKAHQMEDIVVTTIDEYQGDENDYVLISLVRTVAPGFLGEQNRLCVAASRARCGSYFFGNKSTMMRSKAWLPVFEVMERNGYISKESPIICPRHPSPSLLFGHFCKVKCAVPLECGHICQWDCHPDGHHPICQEIVEYKCAACDGDLSRKCHVEEIDIKCTKIIYFDCDRCKKERFRECHIPEKDVKCMEIVEYEGSCGHTRKRECHSKSEPKCFVIDHIECPKCKNINPQTCWEKTTGRDIVCKHNCVQLMQCGHPCQKSCGEECPETIPNCEGCKAEQDRRNIIRKEQMEAIIQKITNDEPRISKIEDTLEVDKIHQLVQTMLECTIDNVKNVFEIHNSQRRNFFYKTNMNQNAVEDPEKLMYAVLRGRHSDHNLLNKTGAGLRPPIHVSTWMTSEEAKKIINGQLTGNINLVLCQILTGKVYCSKEKDIKKEGPQDGFQSCRNSDKQWGIWNESMMLPMYKVEVGVSIKIQNQVASPKYWQNRDPTKSFSMVPVKYVLEHLNKLIKASSHPHCRGGKDGTNDFTTIIKVERIENHRLWMRYKNKQHELRNSMKAGEINILGYTGSKPAVPECFKDEEDVLDSSLNEFWLFHGVRDTNAANSIASEGFDERVANDGGLYGAGIYFASQACKSFQYANGRMFLARVTLGEIHYPNQGHQGRRAPARATGKGTCDSVVAAGGQGSQVHHEYIVYDKAQTYPAYLIHFK
eukprot:GHVL01030242.1.p1 GENE.GHVL01030242.1~~GHVL01030242.1.p1  ORF type:complete len:2110 (+),score=387.14 GHVL01030242.1:120-6449(+)